MIYECSYMPLIFWFWSLKDRRDTPELALHFQLSAVMASSEALFYGGLTQIISRYAESDIPRCVAVSLLGRCFSKIVDRSGFWDFFSSRCWPNKMCKKRDLIGRHKSVQYCYGFLFVVMFSISGFGMFMVEAISKEQFETLYTRPVFWAVIFVSAIVGLITEMLIAALSFWHRRKVPGAGSFLGTFLAMHQPGMQPYFKNLRQIFGTPARRDFEGIIMASPITDTCVSFMGCVSPRTLVLMSAILTAYCTGPSAQALGFVARPDSAFCS